MAPDAAQPPPVTVPMRRLRATLRAVLAAVEDRRDRVVLTRRGRPVAALVPYGALAALDLLGRMLPDIADVTAGLDVAPVPPEPAPARGPHDREA